MTGITKAPCDEAVIYVGSETTACDPTLGRWVLVATILGSSMAFIDGTVVNVALPVLQTDLGATGVQVQWVVQTYALFLSALILVGGSMGDHLGRKRVFLWGVSLFAVASIWCGLAPTVNQLIMAQAVKGIGGALLVPGSLAIISATFSEAQRGRAIGTWSGFTAMTTALGPVLGGWLVENVSWRAVFFINVPLAIVVLALTGLYVPESRDETVSGTPLDWRGALLATVGIGGIIYGLTAASRSSLFAPQAIGPFVAGIVTLLAFVWLESRLKNPMLPLQVFRVPTFSGANLLTLLLYAALGGALYFFPFNLIQVQGYSPTAAGASLLPFILIMFFLSRWSGGLVERYGARQPLIFGPLIAAAGFALFAVPGIGGSYWTTYFPAVTVLGLGMVLTVAPLTTAVMNSVATHQSGIASGVNNAVSRVAGLFGIAGLGILMTATFNTTLDRQLAPLALPTEAQQVIEAERVNLAAAQIPAQFGADTQTAINHAISQAYVAGFRWVMLVAAGLAVISSLCAGLLIRDKHE